MGSERSAKSKAELVQAQAVCCSGPCSKQARAAVIHAVQNPAAEPLSAHWRQTVSAISRTNLIFL